MVTPERNKKIVILGAGPTGLGAAFQLHKSGYDNWMLFEASEIPGGLASSVVDDKGFTWDLGGHVQFSHYKEFDQVMDLILPNGWIYHNRSTWIWMRDRFIPYPFQLNFDQLTGEEARDCLEKMPFNIGNGITGKVDSDLPFDEWIIKTFGCGIADSFMFPYNEKVWAYPLNSLSSQWISDRVAALRKEDLTKKEVDDRRNWGSNRQFQFPLSGGTGAIWKAVAALLPPDKIRYGHEMISISTKERKLVFRNGHKENYEELVSTIPLDNLIGNSDVAELKDLTKELEHSSTVIIGTGIKGNLPQALKGKSWIYFPENNSPFYRGTIFSNYSPNNVPDGDYWSVMTEVSMSKYKQVNTQSVMEDVIRGLIQTRIIESKTEIVSKWKCTLEYGYPIPTLNRDQALNIILPSLKSSGVFSRGRFGAWKYEVSNQDHSFMQGVECVNHILTGSEEITLFKSDLVNQGRVVEKIKQ